MSASEKPTPQMIAAIVTALEAQDRIPDEYRDFTFFSVHDIWRFELHRSPGTCEACEELEGSSWPGSQLRTPFPYLTILDADTIGGPDAGDGLVHKNCRCRLRRVVEDGKPPKTPYGPPAYGGLWATQVKEEE